VHFIKRTTHGLIAMALLYNSDWWLS